MYRNTAAVIRPDLQAVVEQARGAERFLIADRILPIYPVARRNGEYHFLGLAKAELLATDLGNSTLRAPKTAYKRVDRTYEKKSFLCVDRGLTEAIDDGERKDVAPSFDMESTTTRLLVRNNRLAREARVASTIMNASTFTSDNSKVAYTEGNIETLDIAYDIEAAIAKVNKRGEMTNTIIMSRNVWSRIRRSTLLRKYIFGESGGNMQITREVFAKAFSENGAITVEVAEASYSTAKKGQAVADANLGYIWGDTYIWVGSIATGVPTRAVDPSMNGPITLPEGVGATFVWAEEAPSQFVVETYRDEDIKSDIVRVRNYDVEHIMNANSGTLITTQYA
jgi:hypothetical protein